MDRELFRQQAASIGLELSSAQLDSFEQFEEALYEANKVMNLTRVPREEAWSRHFIDSLLFHDLIPKGATVLDIGSGPGFPAWPLAAARPDILVTALDANGKTTAFLQSQALPNLQVVQDRAEDFPQRERYEIVTGRALAPLAMQLELSAAACKVGGLVLPLRSKSDLELAQSFDASRLGLALEKAEVRLLPGTDIERLFPVYRKLKPTPAKYPRRWSEIKNTPLT